MDLNNLSNDQKVKLRACKSEDELRDLAEEHGTELSDDQLEAVSGGSFCHSYCERVAHVDDIIMVNDCQYTR